MLNLFHSFPTRRADLFEQMQRALDQAWGEGSSSSMRGNDFPPVNVRVNEHGALVTCELPGVDENDIVLSLEGDTLTISCKRTIAPPEKGTVLRREREDFEFTRSVRLPFTPDTKAGEASYKDGILSVNVHRAEADKPRRIAIESS